MNGRDLCLDQSQESESAASDAIQKYRQFSGLSDKEDVSALISMRA